MILKEQKKKRKQKQKQNNGGYFSIIESNKSMGIKQEYSYIYTHIPY